MNFLHQAINNNHKILILGFGREGRSIAYYIQTHYPYNEFWVSDANSELFKDDFFIKNPHIHLIAGAHYLDSLSGFNLIIKSPGISTLKLGKLNSDVRLITQTGLFLQEYHSQTIGITGTKGKSTTSSLIAWLIDAISEPCVFAGNIGVAVYDVIPSIDSTTCVVLEISSHQLECSVSSPHVSVLLNLYQEHLDHYLTFLHYQKAKFNIARFQEENDFFIFHHDSELIRNLIREDQPKSKLLPFSLNDHGLDGSFIRDESIWHRFDGKEEVVCSLKIASKVLPGTHNLLNIQAALLALHAYGFDVHKAVKVIGQFVPLEHRLEYVGEYHGRHFYNDSIATIPEACIQAVEALKSVDVLIVGGFDRGIDYSVLSSFFENDFKGTVLYTGDAGRRIFSAISPDSSVHARSHFFNDFDEMVRYAIRSTPENGVCLLSPAAASYDRFKNFEERGKLYKEIILKSSI